MSSGSHSDSTKLKTGEESFLELRLGLIQYIIVGED